MFQKILVPVDGSPISDAGISLAIKLAAPLHAKVRFVYVVEPARVLEVASAPITVLEPDIAKAAGKEFLAEAVARARSAEVNTSSELAEGPATDKILEAARSFGADVIVMGTHGRGGIMRAVLGSVAEGVIRRAHIPVLVTR